MSDVTPARMESKQENLWGYLKRLRFVQRVIAESFPNRPQIQFECLMSGVVMVQNSLYHLPVWASRLRASTLHAESIEHAKEMGADVATFKSLY